MVDQSTTELTQERFGKTVAAFATLLVVGWVAMTVTHELGHVIGGWVSGATLTDLDLAPWRLPYSLHNPDPYPLVTLWSGPVLGATVPYALAAIIRRFWATFVADFCLLANGIYIALAWVSGDHLLDTPRLLNAGAHPVSVTVFCAVTLGIGYTRFRRDCIDCFQPRSLVPSTEKDNV